MQDQENKKDREAVFAEALRKYKQENNPDVEYTAVENTEEEKEEAQMELQTAEDEADDLEYIDLEVPEEVKIAVPPERPDTVGKVILCAGKGVHILLKPLIWLANLLFAPIIKPLRKGADQITRRDWCLFGMMLMAVALLIGTVNLSVWLKGRYHAGEALYTVSMGLRECWEDGKFSLDEDGNSVFSSGDYTIQAEGQPYYYEDQDQMLLNTPYIWYPVNDTYARALERYSILKLSSDGVTAVLPNGTEQKISGYLYDNRDTYIFLETVYVTCGEETLRLPPLSFVKTYQGGKADIYPYGREEGYFLSYEDSLDAEFENGAGVCMSGDIMYYANGMSRLIQDSVEDLKMLGE